MFLLRRSVPIGTVLGSTLRAIPSETSKFGVAILDIARKCLKMFDVPFDR